MAGTVAERLADWVVALRLDDVPEPVRHAARRHLLDGLGDALASARAGVVDAPVSVALGLGGPPESTVLTTDVRVSAPAAALAGGALVHGLDFDDTHAGGLVHATAVVLPAVLAVGEQVDVSGADLLAAAVVGYEVVCRVAAASPHGFHARGLHATQVAGTLAAAAVASRLLGLDAATTTDALGIAGSSSGGLLEFLTTGASTKQLHPGSAALNGILAARLAAAGASGPSTVLEGPHGVYAALSARDADPESVVEGLGTRWETTRITIKPYPSCQLMHVTLDAVREVMPLPVEQIDAIEADVHPDSASIVCEPADVKVEPRTAYDAKFSLPWSVAALVVDGHVGIDTYSPESIARPEVAALSHRVRTHVTAADGVAADAPGHVRVRLHDGTVLEGRVPRSAGGPDLPLSDADLVAKFLSTSGGRQALADAVLALGSDPSVTAATLARLSSGSAA
ncbi:MAG: MmgE/PrpD family protein [Candidatus Nanopelagicales bacterium]